MGKSNEIDLSNFSRHVAGILTDYCDNVTEQTEKWCEYTARETAKNIKANARRAGFQIDKEGSKYINGWTIKQDLHDWYVHNKDNYRLAHLLENGHYIVHDGVVVGRAKAYSHIKEAEEQLEQYYQELKRLLGEGNK